MSSIARGARMMAEINPRTWSG